MAKNKRRRVEKSALRHPKASAKYVHGVAKPSNGAVKKQRQPTQQQHLKPTIPFDRDDRILLVGEGLYLLLVPFAPTASASSRKPYYTNKHTTTSGDFSFASSLLTHQSCTSLLATSYDTHATLLEKYPQAAEHISLMLDEGQGVLYGVDARKLGERREISRGKGWDRIIWNFPHTGGVTKDVNRQVRGNQELLVSFFTSALPLLSIPHGTIILTIFDGLPYSLWNVKDLARHVGLKVGRSFKFRSEAYPGYRHARTLGNVEGGGGWRGEERGARTFVFEVDGEQGEKGQEGGRKRKKKAGDSDSDDEI
ncbi:MAG: hypothetical protein M1827_000592 [Pycnora praestabilis]|nr:MAG: hypothetical protein M1827_000592 [Pycnora praestabilis]